MIVETKRYKQYLKDNNVIIGSDYFIYDGKIYDIHRDGNRWYVEQFELCLTKTSAIYFYIKTVLK